MKQILRIYIRFYPLWYILKTCFTMYLLLTSGGSGGKESACNVGGPGLILASGRTTGEGNGNPLQYSCLENSMDRGAWRATVHGVPESRIWLRNWNFTSLLASVEREYIFTQSTYRCSVKIHLIVSHKGNTSMFHKK